MLVHLGKEYDYKALACPRQDVRMVRRTVFNRVCPTDEPLFSLRLGWRKKYVVVQKKNYACELMERKDKHGFRWMTSFLKWDGFSMVFLNGGKTNNKCFKSGDLFQIVMSLREIFSSWCMGNSDDDVCEKCEKKRFTSLILKKFINNIA